MGVKKFYSIDFVNKYIFKNCGVYVVCVCVCGVCVGMCVCGVCVCVCGVCVWVCVYVVCVCVCVCLLSGRPTYFVNVILVLSNQYDKRVMRFDILPVELGQH